MKTCETNESPTHSPSNPNDSSQNKNRINKTQHRCAEAWPPTAHRHAANEDENNRYTYLHFFAHRDHLSGPPWGTPQALQVASAVTNGRKKGQVTLNNTGVCAALKG